MPKDEPSRLPITCARCRHRWYGIDRAHCTTCHRTFADAELFHRHRVEYHCQNPATLGMVKHRNSGVWEPRVPDAPRRRVG